MATWSIFGSVRCGFGVLNHPDLVEEVLVTKNRHFIKHGPLREARPAWATAC